MQDEDLRCVARRRVICLSSASRCQSVSFSRLYRGRKANLRLDHDPLGLLQICILIEVHRADPIRVTHDGDLCGALDVADEGVAASRDDEIDVLVLLQ